MESIRALLCDPVTQNVFEKPIVLACGHTLDSNICEALVQNESIVCPICRAELEVMAHNKLVYGLLKAINMPNSMCLVGALFKDPVTKRILENPHVWNCGHTFEKDTHDFISQCWWCEKSFERQVKNYLVCDLVGLKIGEWETVVSFKNV